MIIFKIFSPVKILKIIKKTTKLIKEKKAIIVENLVYIILKLRTLMLNQQFLTFLIRKNFSNMRNIFNKK